MKRSSQAANFVLHGFRPLLELDRTCCEEIGRTRPIPTFPLDIVDQICEGAKTVFERTDVVMDLHAPFYVVGDIHGNIFDLLRIFIHAGCPPRSRFLFLGDYVDRGEYSIEVLVLLFAMLLTYPEHIFLLRGNHEFESMNSSYGFSAEVISQYQTQTLYNTFNAVFQWMPLVAILDDRIFCVHGGIAPHAKSIAQLRKIKRPLVSYDNEFVADLVWSDPCVETKACDESTRGLGVQFGVKPLQDFLAAMNLKLVLRAHQCIPTGIQKFAGDLLYTIFSCSRYEGQGNCCGLMFLDLHLQIELFSLPPLDQIPRSEALLLRFVPGETQQDMQISDSLALNVKLFAVGTGKWKMAAGEQGKAEAKKENLLQTFQRLAPAVSSRITPLKRIPPRPASVEPKRSNASIGDEPK